jgi:ABC-type multidrug transport system ATPase subunit
VIEPQLLYLDEPTLGVDVQSHRAIWNYILTLRDQGKTVLITTNYLEEAQCPCGRPANAVFSKGSVLPHDICHAEIKIYFTSPRSDV